ncbi:phage minor capsid protein [Faecalibacillus intestinalis]|uniref:phage minor capsid protein n=1 Tax=Faecalibacillus intestinalis TaxID=1982626 RepID=UPI00352197DE
MLTDKFLEESGDDVSNDFTTLETLLLIWMGLRLRNLSSLEDIEEEYPKWKNKACREFFEYSGTEFQKVKKSSQNKVKSAIKNGIAMTVSNIFSRLKDTDAQTSKKDMLNRSNKNLNKGIKDTQGEIKNLCNISRKCTNKQFIKACDEAYSKIVAGNNADKAIESSIRKLSQKGIEVVGYTDHTTSMDAAVKRAVTSGVNQTSLKFKMDNCKELGINIVKTSSHGGARPSHQEWQGKLFYLHTPVKGLQNFKKATGYGRVDGLGGANCRHSFYEVTDYEYKNNLVDTEEFDKNRNDDQYELEQKQRYYERQIRSWKKRKNILDECGVDSTKEAKKIREWQDKRSQFIKDSNIQFKKEHGIDNVLKKAYTREKVVNKNIDQMYRPVKRSGSDIDFKYSEDVKIKAQRVTTYGDEVYVSDNTKIKPMTLHRIKTHNDEILKEYGIDKKPKIVIFDINEYSGAYGKYNAVDNTVYYCSDILSKELKKDVDTVRHELWHMNQAEEYRAKFGEITDENHLDYIAYTCGVAKKYIDKMGINEYNVGEISDYAKKMYKYSRYDEVEAEYIASTSRKGRK